MKARARTLARALALAAIGLGAAVSTVLSTDAASTYLVSQDADAQQPESEPSPSPAPTPAGEEATNSSLNLHQWGTVSLFHGLPSDHVRAIAQDEGGIVWFATDNGLAKYDGRRVQKVAPPKMPAGALYAMAFDSHGNLWLGGSGGAGLLVGERYVPVPQTSGHVITSIIQTRPSQVVLTSDDGNVFDCNPGARDAGQVTIISLPARQSSRADRARQGPMGGPTPPPGEPGSRAPGPYAPSPPSGTGMPAFNCIVPIGDKLILGTSGAGLLQLASDKLTEVDIKPRPFFIRCVAADPNGKLWFGAESHKSDGGLYFAQNLSRPQRIQAQTGTVNGICFDARGNLWAATEREGAFRLHAGNVTQHFTVDNTAGGLRSDLVYCVFVDREGVLWFGTDRGVCRFDPASPHVERLSNDPQSNFVRTVLQSSDGTIWCGTNRGLFYKLPGSSSQDWSQAEGLESKVVHSIAEPAPGLILVGSAGGLYESTKPPGGVPTIFLPIAEAGPQSPPLSVRAICRYRGATYLASFTRGLLRLDGDSLTPIWQPGPGPDRRPQGMLSLYTQADSPLWIGTESGLFRYDGNGVQDAGATLLHDQTVWSIAGAGDGGVWLATSSGLYSYLNGKLTQAMSGQDVRAVVAGPNQSSAWCGTYGSGLFLARRPDGIDLPMAKIDTERGLPSNSVFAIATANSADEPTSLLVATNRGIARYTPESLPPSLKPIRIIGKRQYQPEEMKNLLFLQYPQNSLLVEVMGISSRTFPEQYQYAFSVKDAAGHPIKTVVTRDPQFVVSNLSPGEYSLKAIVYASDIIPSEPLEIRFQVGKAPFPWTSTALAILLTLSLTALCWGNSRNLRLLAANKKLEVANRQLAETRLQLANETENERRRIARDLHDQTLSDLRRLLLAADQISPRDGSKEQAAGLRQQIESISTEIRHICEDLSPSVLVNVGLVAALEFALTDAVAHLPEDRKFEYEFTADDDIEDRLTLGPATRIQIYRIVQEAISNVGRHAAARRVKLGAHLTGQTLCIDLEDDGRGFDPSPRSHREGRGLNNIRSRADLIGATVSWETSAGGGTRFRLRKPDAADNRPVETGSGAATAHPD